MFKFNKESILNKVKEGFDKDSILNKVKDGIEHIKSDVSKKNPDEHFEQIFNAMKSDDVFSIEKEDDYWLATSNNMNLSIERKNKNVLTFILLIDIDDYDKINDMYTNNRDLFSALVYSCNLECSMVSLSVGWDNQLRFKSHIRLDSPPPDIFDFLIQFRDEVEKSLELLNT